MMLTIIKTWSNISHVIKKEEEVRMTRKSIEVFYDGERYDSMTELAQHLGVSRQRVSQSIRQGNLIKGQRVELGM